MFTSTAGYQMPAFYKQNEEEHRAVRERVGMMDLSLMSRFDVQGRDSMEFLQELAVNDVTRLVDGQILYTTLCNERGSIMDDLTIWRFGDRHFRIVTSSIMRLKTFTWVKSRIKHGKEVYITDISSALGMISVQGPLSRETLRRASNLDLRDLKFFHFTQAKIQNVDCLIARVGYSGELGYECYFTTEDTCDGWNKILEAGEPYSIQPYGFDTLDSLRYEKGFIFYGYEVTEQNNPYEVGLERWISFEKADFVGKSALIVMRDSGVSQKLVGLEIDDVSQAEVGQEVRIDRKKIGKVVVSFRGITIQKNLAWAYVLSDHSNFGQEVTIENMSKELPAKVVNIRYYDPLGKRMRE